MPFSVIFDMADRANLISNAAPIDGTVESFDVEAQQQNDGSFTQLFKKSSHPVALFFHLAFRIAALVIYFFASVLNNFILSFILIILLVAFDFWTVKNVTGRLLVGLRWWNEIKEDGTNTWIFESRENRQVNAVDSRVFWTSLYVTPAIWAVFALLALIRFSFEWVVVSIVALTLSMANVIGYMKCEKDASQKFANFVPGQNLVQGVVGNYISNRFGSFFTGAR